MGLMEGPILQQAKKEQGETNTLLHQLIAEQRRTNDILDFIARNLAPQRTVAPPMPPPSFVQQF